MGLTSVEELTHGGRLGSSLYTLSVRTRHRSPLLLIMFLEQKLGFASNQTLLAYAGWP